MNRLRTAAHRAPIFLGLGSVLATGAVAPGCRSSDDAPTSQADLAPEKGVRTLVSEVAPGRYVIDEEVLVDTATQVIVRRLNGTTERITDPDRFAALLVPPDSARMLAALAAPDTLAPVSPGTAAAPAPGASVASSGGGGSWDGSVPADVRPEEASRASGAAPRHYGSGFPLGHLLFYSLAMNAWRPAAYAGTYTSAPRTAYRNQEAERRSGGTATGFAAAQRSGQAPKGLEEARTRNLARSRAATSRSRASSPSRGRSGFGRSWGRSGG